jgi:hypothetical protein
MSGIDLTDSLVAFEAGDLSEEESVALFQELIDSGFAWTLPGFYGRTAHDLIEHGLCTLGPHGTRDYYGNYVPSRTEVKPGTPGSIEYVLSKPDEEGWL